MAKPTLKQALDALKRQVLVGKSYLQLAKGLLSSDPVLRQQTSPTFFGLTVDGSLELAQMAVARLYDKTKGAVTFRTMLHDAACQVATFPVGPQVAIDVMLKSAQEVIALQPILDVIRKRRDAWLAHLDPETVANPKALAGRAKLTIPDLERAFGVTERIVVQLSTLYEGIFSDLKFIGGDDYEVVLDWIRSAKCTFIENYEKEFHLPFDGPRPKDCSRKHNLLKMQ